MEKENKNKMSCKMNLNRGNFIYTVTKAFGSAALLFPPLTDFAVNERVENNITVGQVMDMFISEVPNAPFDKTVDTLKAGNRDVIVTGIVTSMFASRSNTKNDCFKRKLIIAHEPTFYKHLE